MKHDHALWLEISWSNLTLVDNIPTGVYIVFVWKAWRHYCLVMDLPLRLRWFYYHTLNISSVDYILTYSVHDMWASDRICLLAAEENLFSMGFLVSSLMLLGAKVPVDYGRECGVYTRHCPRKRPSLYPQANGRSERHEKYPRTYQWMERQPWGGLDSSDLILGRSHGPNHPSLPLEPQHTHTTPAIALGFM